MPGTLVTLTLEEYQGIMDRLAVLEAWQTARANDIAPVLQRLQGVESTVSAIGSTVATMPKLDARIAVLERSVLTTGAKTL